MAGRSLGGRGRAGVAMEMRGRHVRMRRAPPASHTSSQVTGCLWEGRVPHRPAAGDGQTPGTQGFGVVNSEGTELCADCAQLQGSQSGPPAERLPARLVWLWATVHASVSWEQGGCAGACARLRGSRAAGGHAARPPRPRPSLLARPQAVPSGTCHSGCTWQVPLTQEGLGRGAAAPAGLPPRGSRKRLVQRPPFLRDAFSLRGKSRTRCRPFRRASGRSEAHCRRKEFGRAGPASWAGGRPSRSEVPREEGDATGSPCLQPPQLSPSKRSGKKIIPGSLTCLQILIYAEE